MSMIVAERVIDETLRAARQRNYALRSEGQATERLETTPGDWAEVCAENDRIIASVVAEWQATHTMPTRERWAARRTFMAERLPALWGLIASMDVTARRWRNRHDRFRPDPGADAIILAGGAT